MGDNRRTHCGIAVTTNGASFVRVIAFLNRQYSKYPIREKGGRVLRDAWLWNRRSRVQTAVDWKNSVSPTSKCDLCQIRERSRSKIRVINAFDMLCPRYGGLLLPTGATKKSWKWCLIKKKKQSFILWGWKIRLIIHWLRCCPPQYVTTGKDFCYDGFHHLMY